MYCIPNKNYDGAQHVTCPMPLIYVYNWIKYINLLKFIYLIKLFYFCKINIHNWYICAIDRERKDKIQIRISNKYMYL